MTNRVAISRWLDEAAQVLLSMRDQIEAGKSDELLVRFEQLRAVREQWLTSRPNLRPGEAEFENIHSTPIERPSLFGRWGRGRRP
jgi:prephenate dehydrogenase